MCVCVPLHFMVCICTRIHWIVGKSGWFLYDGNCIRNGIQLQLQQSNSSGKKINRMSGIHPAFASSIEKKEIVNNGSVWWHALLTQQFLLARHNTNSIYALIIFISTGAHCTFIHHTHYTYAFGVAADVIILPIKTFYEIFQTMLKSNVDLLHSIFHYYSVSRSLCSCSFTFSHAVSMENFMHFYADHECSMQIDVKCAFNENYMVKRVEYTKKVKIK